MGVPRGAGPPSHTAYFVALGGVLLLLLMLLAYCLFFCLRRIKELATQPLPEPVKSVRPPPPDPSTYPVQPVVRESATAMARLCKQMPTHTDTVHPTLSPNKPTMLPTPPRSPGHSPARVRSPGHSPARIRSPGHSPARSPGHPGTRFAPYTGTRTSPHATPPSQSPARVTRSPGSKPMMLPPPKIITHSPKRPQSMPEATMPVISVSEVQ